MNKAQQEAYLKEYSQAKKEGKPFFPYAIYKDHLVAILAFAWIIGMAIFHKVEIGKPVYSATTDFVPRPEWYFFFLFELLKIFKGQNVAMPLIMATFIVPNVLMLLLVITPFIDRSPERRISRRPIALSTAAIIFALLAWLTYKGATSEAPTAGAGTLTPGASASAKAGYDVVKVSGCTGCHVIGAGGGNLGPNLNNEGSKNRGIDWHIAHLKDPPSKTPGSAMTAFKNFSPQQYQDIATFLDGLGTKWKVQ